MTYPIFIASSPNTEFDDFLLSLRTLFNPFSWNNTKKLDELKTLIGTTFQAHDVFLADSGRTSLYLILKSLDLKASDEILVPAFTCLVVANAAFWSGAKPVYIETSKDDLNIDLSDLENKINTNTKVILVQHTFGKLVDIKKIKDILKTKNSNALIIEDWAHSLDANQRVEGDAAFMTFGIEKVISSVRGGAIITDNEELAVRLEKNTSELKEFPTGKMLVCLLNPIFWYIAVPLHAVGIGAYSIGAVLRGIWRKFGFLGIMIEKSEHKADKPDWFPAKFSPALARLAIKQLKKLDKLNSHRQEIAKIYDTYFKQMSDYKKFDNTRTYLRYPIILRDSEQQKRVWDTAKKQRVTLGDWYVVPLYSKYVNDETYEKIGFDSAEFPVTSDKCSRVLNLPTHIKISKKRARKLSKEILRKL